jgi:hypothetical protein
MYELLDYYNDGSDKWMPVQDPNVLDGPNYNFTNNTEWKTVVPGDGSMNDL